MNNNLISTLSELVSIPSITRSPEEIKIVEYTYNLLKDIEKNNTNSSGVKITIERVDERSQENIYHWGIICDISLPENHQTVWLLWHLDVVPVVKDNWHTDPFILEEFEDRFYWRWTCDMKAWISIMIEILKKSLIQKPNKNISLLFTSWEECGIPNGLTEIIKSEKIWSLDFVIALEPTNGNINTWVFWYLDGIFKFKWKSCHSSKPELWSNAIHKTGKLIEYLNNPDIVWEIRYNWELLREALSATNIRWWIASNTVPDMCEVQTNYRYSPERDWVSVENKFKQIAKQVWAESFTTIEHNPSSKIVTINDPMIIDFINKTRLDTSTTLEIVPFWSDISQTSEKGITSINFWPGNIDQAHTDNEFLMKASLEKTENLFDRYLFN